MAPSISGNPCNIGQAQGKRGTNLSQPKPGLVQPPVPHGPTGAFSQGFEDTFGSKNWQLWEKSSQGNTLGGLRMDGRMNIWLLPSTSGYKLNQRKRSCGQKWQHAVTNAVLPTAGWNSTVWGKANTGHGAHAHALQIGALQMLYKQKIKRWWKMDQNQQMYREVFFFMSLRGSYQDFG